MDYIDKIRLRGQAEEDLFFAELDRQLIKALHEQQQQVAEGLKTENNQENKPPSPPHK
jgi:hypothetical protein